MDHEGAEVRVMLRVRDPNGVSNRTEDQVGGGQIFTANEDTRIMAFDLRVVEDLSSDGGLSDTARAQDRNAGKRGLRYVGDDIGD